MKQIKILSPAKINIFLEVTGKREDGYHNLITLMCGISLYDDITVDFNVSKTFITCDSSLVPVDESNIALKAAMLFYKEFNQKNFIHIDIKKNIPVGAGLGGGSSNAASILKSLNEYYGFPFTTEKLCDIGKLIGADVPFFIFNKPAIATGIGDELEFINIEPYHVLVIYPGYGISTADVYKKFNFALTNKEKNITNASLKKGCLKSLLHNDLESVSISVYPEIKKIKDILIKEGSEGSLMSGSGTSVFGLFSDYDKAKKAYKFIKQNYIWQIYLAQLSI
ncbi:MAG: 4-(cytidine 5'-diphospho)-2-C-methyl-D-erythritol kinase [Desulfobacterales bacterium]|nr:4-(cytidine 5'-diphospho)-2-C-methyl-D-erythritol kinase [Desulfobacterales bacterium]